MSEEKLLESKQYEKYYDLLEVKADAPFTEIKSSYLHLKKLYSSDSAVVSSMMEEMSDARREKLLEEIERAYETLKEYYSTRESEKQAVTRDRVFQQNIPEFEVYSGNALKLTREVLNVELQEISLATGIPYSHLKNIELERFDLLPPGGYIRIYVSKYAEYLSLNTKRVLNDYMKAVEAKKSGNGKLK